MRFMIRPICAIMIMLWATSSHAQDENIVYTDLDLSIDFSNPQMLVAANSSAYSAGSSAPNIPDSAFTKPSITANNVHMYLGLASMALGALTGITAPDGYDPDLLNSVHYKAGKLSWQFGAAAIGTGLWTHWDDFHLEDGLFDRDNLHVILGTLGVVGYYLAAKSAVDQYNTDGYPTTDHASYGMFGGGAMLTAIAITW